MQELPFQAGIYAEEDEESNAHFGNGDAPDAHSGKESPYPFFHEAEMDQGKETVGDHEKGDAEDHLLRQVHAGYFTIISLNLQHWNVQFSTI